MISDTIFKLVILGLMWLVLFVGVKIIGRQIYAAQTQNEPETDPCDTCLRWPECHAVDAEICPHIPKGGRSDA